MSVSKKKRQRVAQKTNGRCFYCNARGSEIDHFVSRHKHKKWSLNHVGKDVDRIENLFLSCRTCNSKKHAKTPEEFIGDWFTAWYRWWRANKRLDLVDEKDLSAVTDGLL